MLRTRVTEDVNLIAVGFISFLPLTILSTIVMLECKESLRNKNRSGQRILIRKASKGASDAAM